MSGKNPPQYAYDHIFYNAIFLKNKEHMLLIINCLSCLVAVVVCVCVLVV
ncbi:hypothetical protein IC575_013694 [Cucumis melo]